MIVKWGIEFISLGCVWSTSGKEHNVIGEVD